MKNKKIITCLLILVTFCIGVSNVGATPNNTKTCSSYKTSKTCNNNSSCKWVEKNAALNHVQLYLQVNVVKILIKIMQVEGKYLLPKW